MTAGIDLELVDQITAGHIGQHDVACPLCGPQRHSPLNRRRKTLRIWRIDPGFATFHCARCGERGHTRDPHAAAPDPTALARARAEAADRDRIASTDRLAKARWLWSRRRPIVNTVAETYLRTARAYTGPLPATLGYLPARDEYPPAMIAAFGIPGEPEPGRLIMRDDAVRGIHITRLSLDGSAKAGTDVDKVMIGFSAGSPIVLAPPNDLGGLAITEGIEDALSVFMTTGLGVWAAGAAARLPALADVVPGYVECVTIMADDDYDGRRHAVELARRLVVRGIAVRMNLSPGKGWPHERPRRQ
jgi:hypothetical protein